MVISILSLSHPSKLNVPESFPEKPPVHVAMKTSKAKRLLDDYVIRSIHVDNNSPEKNGPGSIEFDYNNELFTMKVNWKDNMAKWTRCSIKQPSHHCC